MTRLHEILTYAALWNVALNLGVDPSQITLVRGLIEWRQTSNAAIKGYETYT